MLGIIFLGDNMRKITIIIITIGIILGFLIGIYLYNTNQESKNLIIAEKEETKIETKKEDKEVSNQEKLITPNTKIIIKTYYKDCNHIIEESAAPEDEWINLNEEELSKQANNFTIQKFSPEEVVLYKEENGFCNEHYLLIEKNGYIEVYFLDEKGEMKFMTNIVDIATELLPEKDREELKTGIKVYGKKELNKKIEDFE